MADDLASFNMKLWVAEATETPTDDIPADLKEFLNGVGLGFRVYRAGPR